jgi:nicotinate-nucleotide--dimethylbenzimidazole phosphoribosyltransferase
MMKLIEETIGEIRPVAANWQSAAAEHQLRLTKPPGSLGRLEDIANRCAGIAGRLSLHASRPRIVLFAGDHGVVKEGVSMYPQQATTQMLLNCLHGGAAINCLARSLVIDLKVVDMGVATPPPASSDLISRRVRAGTRNFCLEPAMTEAEMIAGINTGIQLAHDAFVEGCDLVGFGEMGVGNTTSASAIAVALSSETIEAMVGAGAGADADCMARKRSAVERALALHSNSLVSPLAILRCLGGFEIAAICGFCLGAASRRLPIVMDGFTATCGALFAVRLCPRVNDYLFAAHRSAEAGHARLLATMRQEPLLDLGMRLGEGTGAALAVKLIQAAIEAFTSMAMSASAESPPLESQCC